MGYRTYIATIPKKEYNKIKSLTKDQLYEFYKVDKEDDYLSVHDFGAELHCFGKYTEFNPPKGSMKKFFKNKETHESYNDDNELMLVTKEFLAYIIETYNRKIKDYYNEMVNPFFGLTGDDCWGKPSEFLNSIKTTYGEGKRNYTFDFSKITPEEQTALFELIEHVRSMRTEWTYLTPYDLEKDSEITTSWKYEYAIFELVRIYKSFDWKKNVMFYYGY